MRGQCVPGSLLDSILGLVDNICMRITVYNGSILTGQDGRSNPDLIGHLNVCLAVSVSLDFIESVLTIHRSLLSEELVNFMLLWTHVYRIARNICGN